MLTVCLCISAFTTETKPMCIDLTSYIAVCNNKKLKFKICVHSPDISKWHRSKINIAQKSPFFWWGHYSIFQQVTWKCKSWGCKAKDLPPHTDQIHWTTVLYPKFLLYRTQGEKNYLLLHIIKIRKCKVSTLFLLESTRRAWALSFPALSAWGWSL